MVLSLFTASFFPCISLSSCLLLSAHPTFSSCFLALQPSHPLHFSNFQFPSARAISFSGLHPTEGSSNANGFTVIPTLLGVPAEIREHIILQVAELEKVNSTTLSDLSSPQTFDFSVNAHGFRCHSMESFNLLFVNKQLHYESIPVIFKHCSVVLYAEVTHSASAFGFVPFMLPNIPQAVKTYAWTVGVKILNIATEVRLVNDRCPIMNS